MKAWLPVSIYSYKVHKARCGVSDIFASRSVDENTTPQSYKLNMYYNSIYIGLILAICTSSIDVHFTQSIYFS